MPTTTRSSTTTKDRTTSAPILPAVGKAPERFVLYALGGGHGHAVRGALVAGELARRGVACRLLVSDRCATIARLLSPGVAIEGVRRPESPAHLERIVRSAIDAHEATDMLVDTFPEGLLGELRVALGVRRWGLLRLRRDALSAQFLDSFAHYHALADVEAHLDWLPHARGVERLPPLARRLELEDGAIALVGGDAKLDAFLARLGRRLSPHAKVVHVDRWLHRIPSVVIGPAGYNLSYELALAGAWHLAIPRPRRFDDQRVRAAAVAELVERPEALERRALTLVRTHACAPRPIGVGGAARVADWLSADEREHAPLALR